MGGGHIFGAGQVAGEKKNICGEQGAGEGKNMCGGGERGRKKICGERGAGAGGKNCGERVIFGGSMGNFILDQYFFFELLNN